LDYDRQQIDNNRNLFWNTDYIKHKRQNEIVSTNIIQKPAIRYSQFVIKIFRSNKQIQESLSVPLNKDIKQPRKVDTKFETDINSDLNCVFSETPNQTKLINFQPTINTREEPKPLPPSWHKTSSNSPSKVSCSRNSNLSKFSTRRQSMSKVISSKLFRFLTV
jgi:hypothetical protein